MSGQAYLDEVQEAIDVLATRLWWQEVLREAARAWPEDDVLGRAAHFAGMRTTWQFRVVRRLLRGVEWAVVPEGSIICVPSLGLVAYPDME